MTEPTWISTLQKIRESPVWKSDRVDLEAFWKQVIYETEAEENQDIIKLFERFSDEQRTAFNNILRELVGPEPLDNEKRLDDYRVLAQFYNCVFRWIDVEEPRKDDDVTIDS